VLIDLVLRGDRRRPVVEVYVDAESGVTAGLCTKVSRDIQEGMDAVDAQADYRLVVSSPGADRPLAHPWQYRKHVGRTLHVRVQTPGGAREVKGVLTAVDDTGFDLASAGGERIAFASVLEARVALPW